MTNNATLTICELLVCVESHGHYPRNLTLRWGSKRRKIRILDLMAYWQNNVHFPWGKRTLILWFMRYLNLHCLHSVYPSWAVTLLRHKQVYNRKSKLLRGRLWYYVVSKIAVGEKENKENTFFLENS